MPLAADLDGTLRQWVDQRGLSGSVLVTTAGETVFEGSYGMANRADAVPVTPRTRFGLASLTKMFTAVCTVSLLAERGLPFATPVVDLLPAQRRPSTSRNDVTVHHLLTHTSGIADYFEEEVDEEPDYADLWTRLPSYSIRRPLDFLPLFGDLEPYRGPGERWQYSNAGYILLGLVIEELAQRPYAEVVQERVFDPAGMSQSGFFALDEAVPDLATGYLPPLAQGQPWRSNIFSIPPVGGADGGALSTARDIDRFLHAYATGALVGVDLRDLMLRPHAEADPGIACGYGVLLYADRFGHGGGDPGVEVLAHRHPDRDTHVIVLCNMTGLGGEIRGLLVDSLLGAADV
jgi:CubicO group peptidase (beta-lactamase class C family)